MIYYIQIFYNHPLQIFLCVLLYGMAFLFNPAYLHETNAEYSVIIVANTQN